MPLVAPPQTEQGPDATRPAELRVLLVEDSAADARLIVEMLRDEPGLSLATATRLSEARTRLAAEAWDAVLLDLLLPDAQGEAVVGAVAEAAPDVAIVVLSGLGDDELALARRAVAVGAQDFIPKRSVDPGLLCRVLTTAVERVRLRRALAWRERQLEEAQRLARVGDFWWRPGETRIGVSRQLQSMLALDDQRPSLRALLRRVAPPDRRRLLAALRRLPHEQAVELELGARTGAGGRGDFRVEMRRGRLHPDPAPLWFGICRDVTHERALARMKDEFVSVVSHELRTPLTCVLGAVAALRGLYASVLPPPAAELLDSAHRNGQRLRAIVDDLLDLQRIESGTLELRLERVELGAQLEEIAEQHRRLAATRRVELNWARPRQPTFALLDPQRLAQAVGNLLTNAIAVSSPGARVELCLARQHDRVAITVADRGPGVPAAMRERIFEKFVQLDASDRRPRQGTGLGLTIVRQLANRMGGSVCCEARPGGGAVFRLTFPCEPLPLEAATADGGATCP